MKIKTQKKEVNDFLDFFEFRTMMIDESKGSTCLRIKKVFEPEGAIALCRKNGEKLQKIVSKS